MDENTEQDLDPKAFQKAIEMADTTQEQLARELGVSLNTVNSWINCRKTPRADNFFALCRELKMSPKTVARLLRIDVTGIPDDFGPPKRSSSLSSSPSSSSTPGEK